MWWVGTRKWNSFQTCSTKHFHFFFGNMWYFWDYNHSGLSFLFSSFVPWKMKWKKRRFLKVEFHASKLHTIIINCTLNEQMDKWMNEWHYYSITTMCASSFIQCEVWFIRRARERERNLVNYSSNWLNFCEFCSAHSATEWEMKWNE